MADNGNPSDKHLKKIESKKSHSWWWDSHISPKNSKWLAESLEAMDRSVKRMLKLIEEDGDSFAKKAEMYYQKRPELISLVEEFYRLYRSLAERYDHVTGELKKSIPSDLQSMGSGMSDVGSEPSSTWPSPIRLGRRISSNRAAGFDFFLGSGGNGPDVGQKEDEYSSLTDSDNESDDSSVNNYSGLSMNVGEHGLNKRIMELEIELREVKEKLYMQEEENTEGSFRAVRNENSENTNAKNNGYENELRILKSKLRISEEEIIRLNIELERLKSLDLTNVQVGSESPTEEKMNNGEDALDLKALERQGNIDELELEFTEPDNKIKSLVEELGISKQKLAASDKEIHSLNYEASKSSERIQQLQDQLDLAGKELASWKSKFDLEKRESSKLQERLARLKTSLSGRDHEIRDLKMAVSDAEQKIFPEKAQLKAEISQMLEEQTRLKEQIREWESRGRSFEEEIRNINSEKSDMEETLKGEIELLKAKIMERENNIKDLNASLDAFKLERDNLNSEIISLKGEVNTRDDRIQSMDKHLDELHIEHVKLFSGMEEAHRQVEKLKSRAKELEQEVERQKAEISEGAEEKREAIRQLCFSLEHYRNSYQTLLQAVNGQKRAPVRAA